MVAQSFFYVHVLLAVAVEEMLPKQATDGGVVGGATLNIKKHRICFQTEEPCTVLLSEVNEDRIVVRRRMAKRIFGGITYQGLNDGVLRAIKTNEAYGTRIMKAAIRQS